MMIQRTPSVMCIMHICSSTRVVKYLNTVSMTTVTSHTIATMTNSSLTSPESRNARRRYLTTTLVKETTTGAPQISPSIRLTVSSSNATPLLRPAIPSHQLVYFLSTQADTSQSQCGHHCNRSSHHAVFYIRSPGS